MGLGGLLAWIDADGAGFTICFLFILRMMLFCVVVCCVVGG